LARARQKPPMARALQLAAIIMQPRTIDRGALARVTGGFTEAEKQAIDDEVARQLRESEREREHEDRRTWERHHRLGAMLCQGDPTCIDRARR
jgi:hypothetical protein